MRGRKPIVDEARWNAWNTSQRMEWLNTQLAAGTTYEKLGTLVNRTASGLNKFYRRYRETEMVPVARVQERKQETDNPHWAILASSALVLEQAGRLVSSGAADTVQIRVEGADGVAFTFGVSAKETPNA